MSVLWKELDDVIESIIEDPSLIPPGWVVNWEWLAAERSKRHYNPLDQVLPQSELIEWVKANRLSR